MSTPRTVRGGALLVCLFVLQSGCGPDPEPSSATTKELPEPALLETTTVDPTCLADDPPKSLPICLRPQEGPFWCWAAVTQMMLETVQGRSPPQTTMMSSYVPNSTCPRIPCVDPVNDCNQPGWPTFGEGIEYKTISGPLLWHELEQEISAGRPVAFSWCWRRNGECSDGDRGHIMIVAGLDPAKQALLVLDPSPCCQGQIGLLLYDKYREGKSYKHWRNYYCLHETSDGTICPDYLALRNQPGSGDLLTTVEASELGHTALRDGPTISREVLDQVLADLPRLADLHVLSLNDSPPGEGELGLGRELPRYSLTLEALLDPDLTVDNVASRLEDTGLILVPLEQNEETVSSFELMRSSDSDDGAWLEKVWQLAGLGLPVFARRLGDSREALENELPPAFEDELVEVWIPALNAHFVAPRRGKWLKIGVDVGSCQFNTATLVRNAAEGLEELKARARKLQDARPGPT